MKNVHLLPTEKPSRFFIDNKGEFHFREFFVPDTIQICKNYNIYITSDEEIKDEDWVIENNTFEREPYIGKCFYPKNDGTVTDEILKRYLLSVKYEGHYETLVQKSNCKKIILTTDQDLIKEGVQAIDDEFLEWFVKNLSCENVVVITEQYTQNYHKDIWYNRYKIIIPQEAYSAAFDYILNNLI